MLTKEEIQAKTALPIKSIPVEEWGGEVRMRALTIIERIDLKQRLHDLVRDVPRDEKGVVIASQVSPKESRKVNTDFLALVLIDELGAPMFSSEELQAMAAEQEIVLIKLAVELYAFNGFSSANVEDEAKKSEASPSGS